MRRLWCALGCLAGLVAGCGEEDSAPAGGGGDAKAFVAKVNADLKRLWIRASTAEWIKSTHITDDTERNAAWAAEAEMARQVRLLLARNKITTKDASAGSASANSFISSTVNRCVLATESNPVGSMQAVRKHSRSCGRQPTAHEPSSADFSHEIP